MAAGTTGLRNWSGNHAYRARTVHEPRSVAELQQLVAGAPALRALGTRHCFNDIADGDALVSTQHLPVEIDVDSAAGTVRVSGGARYGALAEHLQRAGQALHTMASLPHISVAGAVATATHGSGDANPNLAAVVAGLELVTADGTLRTVGPDDPDLPGAVVGLGALGVVTALTLRVQPTYDVVQHVETGLPWTAALEHLDTIMAGADSVSLFTDWRGDAIGQVWRKNRADGAPRPHESFGAVPATGPVHPVPGADVRATTEQLGRPGPWHERLPHFRLEFTPSGGVELQSEYLVDRVHGPAALEAVRGLADEVAPLLLVSEVRSVAADDLWLSTASGRDSLAIHFTWQRRQPEVEAVLPRLEAALAPFAPRPHWGKLFTATGAGAPSALERVYPQLPRFRDLVERHDPDGVFTNDWLRRHVLP